MSRMRTSDEQGMVAVALVIAVSALVALLGALLVGVASANQTNIPVSRDQLQAVEAAEAGLNASYQAIEQVTSPTALPCSQTETLTAPSDSSPPTSSYTATFNYYASSPPSGSPISPCPPSSGQAVESAQIVSTGTDGNFSAYMDGEVTLNTDPFTFGIFTGQTLSINNNNNGVYSATDTGNVYAGSFNCTGSTTIQGTLDVSGSFSESGSCTVAKGSNAVQTLPQIAEPTSASGGWSIVTDNHCGDFNMLLPSSGSITYSANTMILTTCNVNVNNNTAVLMSGNVAIYSTGGFNFGDTSLCSGTSQSTSNASSCTSTSTTTRSLYFIVPSSVSGVPTVCVGGLPAPGINITNGISANTVNTMLYTPCGVDISKGSPLSGQVYGGAGVTLNNGFQLTYAQLPAPPGSSGGTGSLTGLTIVYERQCASHTGC